MKIHKFLSLFTMLFWLTSPVITQTYTWPTDASHAITSSFCEFRPRHYHAALDIKTWQQSGYKIFAIDDGYVYRLRVSANGYGKAIYLKLKDGNFVVYAHLSGFNKPLQRYSDSLRLTTRRLILDTYLKPGQFPVKKGDFLGYTGETGIGVPHLHFEMRDRHERPINPLQFFQDRVTDTIAPRVRMLALIPQSASTYINFLPDTLIMSVPQQETVHLSSPLYLTGKAYLALRTYDLANGASNHFDFYRAEMFVNDSLVYEVQYDRFSYEETRLIELDKNFSLWRKGKKIFHNFYRHPANSLPFYNQCPPGAGLLSGKILREGENRVRIRIFDYARNVCELTIPLVYHRKIPLQTYNIAPSNGDLLVGIKSPLPLEKFEVSRANHYLTWHPVRNFEVSHRDEILSAYYYHLRISLPRNHDTVFRIIPFYNEDTPTLPLLIPTSQEDSAPDGLKDSFQFTFYGNTISVKSKETLPGVAENSVPPRFIYHYSPHAYQAALDVDDIKITPDSTNRLLAELAKWRAVVPGKARTVSSPDGRVSVHFPFNAVYDTIFANIRQYSPRLPLPSPYRYVSDIYDVQPFDQPLNYGAFFSITLPDSLAGKHGVGAYYWDYKKGWLYLPAEFNPHQHKLTARVTSLEKFVLIQDTIPPRITPINLTQSRLGENTALRFSVVDEMAGIYKETRITVFIDDKWSLFEYDPEEEQVIIAPRFLPSGQHEIRIIAKDNADNKATAVFQYTR